MTKSAYEVSPNFVKKSAHWLPSLRVWWREKLRFTRRSFISWI